jgi:hypothetical protein
LRQADVLVEDESGAVLPEIVERNPVAVVAERFQIHEPEPAANGHETQEPTRNVHVAELAGAHVVGQDVQRPHSQDFPIEIVS